MKIFGNFTSYDTIKFDDTFNFEDDEIDEMVVDNYFNFLEENIKNGKILNCSYNPENETFYYEYDGIQYYITIKNNNSRNLRVLMTLLELANSKSSDMKDLQEEEMRKQNLIKKAKAGEIETDEAKELYLNELKRERKELISSAFKFRYNIDGTPGAGASNALITILTSCSIVGSAIAGAIVLSDKGIINTLSSWLLVIGSYGLAASIFAYGVRRNEVPLYNRIVEFLGSTIMFVPNLIKGLKKLITKNLKRIKVINHKIEWLSDYHLPDSTLELSDEDKKSEDLITLYINNVYVAINELKKSEDKTKYLSELLGKIKEYQDSLRHLKSGELTTTNNEQYIRNAFISYLNDLENRINAVSVDNKKNEALDKTISMIQRELDGGEIEVVDGMVRRRAKIEN